MSDNLPAGFVEPPSEEEYIAAGGAVRGVNEWDMGDTEPAGIDAVTDYSDDDGECDSARWGRTTSGEWKGYKNGGKVYLSWAELVRRWGPVTAVQS